MYNVRKGHNVNDFSNILVLHQFEICNQLGIGFLRDLEKEFPSRSLVLCDICKTFNFIIFLNISFSAGIIDLLTKGVLRYWMFLELVALMAGLLLQYWSSYC